MSSVDPKSFFRVASWQCVRTSNATAVARALELLHYRPATVPPDLAEVDPQELPVLVLAHEGWTYVFGFSLGLKGTRQLSAEFEECLAFHIDEDSGTYRCERSLGGEVGRRVYVSQRDHEHNSVGEPAAGEPAVPWLDNASDAEAIGLSGEDVLRFAEAWGTQPQRVVKGGGVRAFVASNKPIVTRSSGGQRSVLGSLLGALLVLAVLGAVGGGVWWLLKSDRVEVASRYCENQWNCSSCVACAASLPHPCAEAFDACEEEEGCFGLMECLSGCQGFFARTGFSAPSGSALTCFEQCRTEHADGLATYCEWSRCSYGDSCREKCTDPGYDALAACK